LILAKTIPSVVGILAVIHAALILTAVAVVATQILNGLVGKREERGILISATAIGIAIPMEALKLSVTGQEVLGTQQLATVNLRHATQVQRS